MPWMSIAASVAGSVISGAMSSDSSDKASSAQAQSAEAGIGEQRRQFDITQANNAPFLQTGTAANRRLAQLLGIGPSTSPGFDNPAVQAEYERLLGDTVNRVSSDPNAVAQQVAAGWGSPGPTQTPVSGYGDLNRKFSASDLNADPVYQSGLKFGLDQGTGAINARATQAGGYDSGATIKALTRYATDYGSTKANESYNRYTNDQNNVYNRLAGVSGTGQVASNQIASAGQNMANNVSDLTTQAGNARAAGIVGGANAWQGAVGGVNQALGNYQNNQMLERLLTRGGSGGTYQSSSTGYSPGYDTSGTGGGWRDGGMVTGPKHEAGGVQLEAEGGEVIIPADVVRKKGSKFFAKLMADHHAR